MIFPRLAIGIIVLLMIEPTKAFAYMGYSECRNSDLNRLIMSGDLKAVVADVKSHPISQHKFLWYKSKISRVDYVNKPDTCKYYPLQAAANSGKLEILRFLISEGANPNTVINYKGDTIVSSCLYTNYTELFKNYPLAGQIKSLEVLINAGADIDHVNSSHETALSVCKNPDFRNALIRLGANPQVVINETFKKYLIELTNTINTMPMNQSALDKAWLNFSIGLRGKPDMNSTYPISLAVQFEQCMGCVGYEINARSSQIELQRKLIVELIAAGADVNAHRDNELPPLLALAEKGLYEQVIWLIEHGANPNVSDAEGDLIVHYSRNKKHSYYGLGQIKAVASKYGYFPRD